MKNKEKKKYEILIDKENTIEFKGRILHRIRALKNFNDVKTGDIGGFVESEWNLSQEGNCWIYDDAKSMDSAKCTDESQMYNGSCMYDNSRMLDNSRMYDNAMMYDNSKMFDNSKMYDNSRMYYYSKMCDNSRMCDYSRMYDNTIMYDNSEMYDYSEMCNNSKMYDNSKMYNNSTMYDNSSLHGNAKASNNAILKDDDSLYGKINKPFKKIFQYQCKYRFLTAILTEENEILYSIGCQTGIAKEEFIDRIYNSYVCEKGNGLVEYPHRQEYLDMIELVEFYFEKFKN